MKLTISTNQNDIKDASGASFIYGEGVYDVTMNFVSVSDTKNGAKQVTFNFKYNGSDQTIYGPIIINKDGTPNTIGMSLINKFGVIAGVEGGQDLTIEKETHKVGKEQKEQEFDVITDFSGLECKIRTQREYSKYNGVISSRVRIQNVFSASGSSAAELVNDKDHGKQMALEIEKYSDKPSYDGVTPEEAQAWEAQQRAGRSGGNKAATTATEVKKAPSLFN